MARRKTLIIHHLQECWQHSYYNITGKHLDRTIDELARYLRRANYDRIILTMFENWQPEDIHYPLRQFNIQYVNYDYGWDGNSEGDNTCYFIVGGNHSEAVLIDYWMNDIADDKVTICGCFDGECLEDLEIALTHLGIEYRRLEKFIA